MKSSPNIIIILGARPQFIKAAPVRAALAADGITVKILHTGQHYDPGMSAVFFEELGMPAPEWNLGCGGGSHGAMTGAMLTEIEKVLMEQKPDMVLVLGDTNSTLAGALAAAKLHIPVAHVEAGLRSFNRRMPEELNRICTDHLSDLLFCSSENGREQLAREGIARGVHVTGDVMADTFFVMLEAARSTAAPLPAAVPPRGEWALMTLHRAENTNESSRIHSIFTALATSGMPVVFPVHPRTQRMMSQRQLSPPKNVRCIDAVGYGELVRLLDACALVLTDSGGLQKEAYWAGKPCITLRDETEWTELVTSGWNVLAGADSSAILHAIQHPPRGGTRPSLYGDGKAATRAASAIGDFLVSAVRSLTPA